MLLQFLFPTRKASLNAVRLLPGGEANRQEDKKYGPIGFSCQLHGTRYRVRLGHDRNINKKKLPTEHTASASIS